MICVPEGGLLILPYPKLNTKVGKINPREFGDLKDRQQLDQSSHETGSASLYRSERGAEMG